MTPHIEKSNSQELRDINELFNKFPCFVCRDQSTDSIRERSHWLEDETSPLALLAANSKMQSNLFWFKGFQGSHSPLLIEELFPIGVKGCDTRVTKN